MLVAALLIITQIFGQSTRDDILINSDDFLYDSENSTAELKGNVQLVYQGQHIRSESATINFNQKVIEAVGNVGIRAQDIDIEAKKAIINYSDQIGTFFDAYIKSGQVEFTGKVIHKTGEKTYVIVDGMYTACRSCPPAWAFNGRYIEAELGGYARIKNPFILFADIPVFWLPYLMVPLKSERQSGLLFPTMEFTSDGNAFAQSFFWAIDRSQDATFTAKFYETRGPKLLTNYRYVLTESSKGEFNGAIIDDKDFKHEIADYRPDQTPIQRWYAKYKHIYKLPDGYTHRVNLNLASDLRYPGDFPLEMKGSNGLPALTNQLAMEHKTDDRFLGLEAAYYVNLIDFNPIASNEDAVHRFPEIRYSLTNQRIGESDFFFNFDINYVNFARSNYTYDDNYISDTTLIRDRDGGSDCDELDEVYDADCFIDRDGEFDENTDFYRTGQRIDIRPSASYPFQWGRYMDFVPEVSYRETRYAFGVGERPNVVRRYIRGKFAARSTFSKIYGNLEDSGASRWKHEIQPELSYTRIPDGEFLSDDSHPFFARESEDIFNERIPVSNTNIYDSDTQRSNLQFDYNDRLFDRNLYTLAIRNKFITKTWVGDTPRYQQLASVLLKQSYDARAAESEDTDVQPYSNLELETEVRSDSFWSNTNFSYFHTYKVSNLYSENRYYWTRQEYFRVVYNLKFDVDIPEDQTLWDNRSEHLTLGAGFGTDYVDFAGALSYNLKDDQASRAGYSINLKPPGNCWFLQVNQRLEPNGEAITKLTFSFMFDGKNRTSVGTEDFDQY